MKQVSYLVLSFGVLIFGCQKESSSENKPESELVYELSCKPFQLADIPDVLCVRVNSHTGDTKVVEASKVPSVADSVKVSRYKRFTVLCDSTQGREPKLTCLRLDRVTGAIARVPLRQSPRLFR